MKVKSELKPCPFCGGSIIKVAKSDALLVKDFVFSRNTVYIGCPSCGAFIGFFRPDRMGGIRKAKEAAFEAWNRRASNEKES